MYHFDEIIDRRGTNALNTDGFRQYICHAGPEKVFPYKDEEFVRMWVADMEFGVAPEILDAILQLFPLDTYVEKPFNLMQVMPGDDVETPIWDVYEKIEEKYEPRGKAAIGQIERFAFYEEAKKAYAVIATGETALYANIMLQKGVVTD